jgi:hypothetical protein
LSSAGEVFFKRVEDLPFDRHGRRHLAGRWFGKTWLGASFDLYALEHGANEKIGFRRFGGFKHVAGGARQRVACRIGLLGDDALQIRHRKRGTDNLDRNRQVFGAKEIIRGVFTDNRARWNAELCLSEFERPRRPIDPELDWGRRLLGLLLAFRSLRVRWIRGNDRNETCKQHAAEVSRHGVVIPSNMATNTIAIPG